jgi:hypothetical protein
LGQVSLELIVVAIGPVLRLLERAVSLTKGIMVFAWVGLV